MWCSAKAKSFRRRFSLSISHINLSKLVNLLTSALFFHSIHIVLLGLFFSPLVALLSQLVLNCKQIFISFRSCFVEQSPISHYNKVTVTIVNFRVNERSNNGAGSSLINSLRISLRSRILWTHDLETAKICCANDIFLSQMTLRLRAESASEKMTLLGRWMVGLLSLESCCGRPKIRNSVLEGLKLRDRKLEDIQLDMIVTVFSRWVSVSERNPEQRTIREVEYHSIVCC